MAVKRLVAAIVLAIVLLSARPAGAEPAPPIHVTVPTTISDAAGHSLALPPGFFLEEATWAALDVELRRLQEAETRLRAENQVFRDSDAPPRWWWVAVGVAVGAAGGFAATRL
jgi:hypothetical protein